MLNQKVSQSKKIIEKAYERFNKLALTWSGGKDSTVLLFLVKDVVDENGWEMPIILALDPIPIEENIEFSKKVLEELKLINKSIFWPDLLTDDDLKYFNPKNKVECCYHLKVVPLNRFIEQNKIEGLFVGIRWDEHPERAKEKYFSKRENPPHYRIHPILHWSWLEVWEYIKEKNLPVNPLYYKGYTSLGCKPCTTIVKKEGFKNIDEIIEFVKAGKVKERVGRDIDKERIMENLRKLGYF